MSLPTDRPVRAPRIRLREHCVKKNGGKQKKWNDERRRDPHELGRVLPPRRHTQTKQSTLWKGVRQNGTARIAATIINDDFLGLRAAMAHTAVIESEGRRASTLRSDLMQRNKARQISLHK